MSIIRITNTSKIYKVGEVDVRAIDNLSLEIPKGSFVTFLGPSGSGKSTLLNLIGGLDRPNTGSIEVIPNGSSYNLTTMKEHELTNYRRNYIGFVFQFYNLVPSLTAFENVLIASKLSYKSLPEAREVSQKFLDEVGLKEKMFKFPGQLSGGEQQRVSIARALAKKPLILIADEPTGNLDSQTTGNIISLLRDINKQEKTTILVATHNIGISYLADLTVYLRDGKLFGTADHDPTKEELFWEQLEDPRKVALS